MPKAVEELANDSIKAALEKRWAEAIALNKEIIDFDDENIPALNRLARAYIELSKFEEAKKTLKIVLKLDPINQTAKKNMEYAQNSKKIIGNAPIPDVKTFIKEPGTTKEYEFILQTKGITSKKFYLGEPLNVVLEKHKASLHTPNGDSLGYFEEDMAEKILNCLKKGGEIKASYLSGEDKIIKILMKSTIPMFKSEKQELKPYIKRDTLEEPEIELAIPEPEIA